MVSPEVVRQLDLMQPNSAFLILPPFCSPSVIPEHLAEVTAAEQIWKRGAPGPQKMRSQRIFTTFFARP